MKDKLLYLLVDLACLAVPLIASFHSRLGFYKHWRSFLPVTIITATLFIVWDALFTHHGVWSFNNKYILGIYLFHLPLEEILFFVCIPYSCLFVFYCVQYVLKTGIGRRLSAIITWVLAALLLATAVLYPGKLYTSVTCSLLGVLLLALGLRKAAVMHYFYLSFLLTFIPFFISNGILTGSFSNEPVVFYNNDFNLHIRLLNIPVEDIFYGMLFQLLNAIGFEYALPKTAAGPHKLSGPALSK